MTREEEIKQAVENNIDVSIYTPKDGELLKETFYIGAKWADENPKSPWISIKDDLPCNHSEFVCGTEVSEGTETIDVFAMNERGDIWTDFMVYENGKWRWNDFEPEFWMIPPKLSK